MSNTLISIFQNIPENIIIAFNDKGEVSIKSGCLLEEPKIATAFSNISTIEDLYEYILLISSGYKPSKEKWTLQFDILNERYNVTHIFMNEDINIERVFIFSRIGRSDNYKKKYYELKKNFKLILDSVPEAAFMIDAKGKILITNKSLAERLKINGSDIIGENIFDLLPQKVAEFRRKKIEVAIRKRRPVYFEDVRNDRIIDTYVYPVEEESSDEIKRLTIVGIDRTQRKKAEKELALKAKLLDSASDTILLLDKKGRIVYFNESAYKTRGYTKEEFAEKKLKEIISPEQSKHLNYRMHNLLITGADTFESEHIKKDGSVFPVEIKSQIIKNNDEEFFLSIIRDISSQKEQELTIKKYINRLEKDRDIIEKNSEDLLSLNQKLAISEKKLKESNRQKDMFFSILAHDLKSPFSAILGYTEILKEDFKDLEDKEISLFLNNLDTVAKAVFELLENLLQWSRLQTGRIEINKEPVNVYQIAEEVLSLYFEKAAQKGITLYNNFHRDSLIYVDKNMLQTIFRNLVSNAIKFTNKNGSINLSSKLSEENIVLEFKDDGKGIEPENMSLLFRLDKNLTTKGTDSESGTGLGLILCKELIEKNGGMISVKSEPGIGSSFFLKFTLLKKDYRF